MTSIADISDISYISDIRSDISDISGPLNYQVQCCCTCQDLEKEDKNLDYGTYYYDDGDRRTDVMEVPIISVTIFLLSTKMMYFNM